MCKKIKAYFEEKQARKEILMGCDNFEIDELIKIQSTDFDRKRKYDSHVIAVWKEDHNNGMSFYGISKKYGASFCAVKYNLDDSWKKSFNAKRDGKHTGIDVCDFMNRVEYKRQLIKSKKIKVAHLI